MGVPAAPAPLHPTPLQEELPSTTTQLRRVSALVPAPEFLHQSDGSPATICVHRCWSMTVWPCSVSGTTCQPTSNLKKKSVKEHFNQSSFGMCELSGPQVKQLFKCTSKRYVTNVTCSQACWRILFFILGPVSWLLCWVMMTASNIASKARAALLKRANKCVQAS
jgi:hypothetical protein